MNGSIFRDNRKIIVVGDLIDFRKLLSHIHIAIDKLGYDDIIIDMSDCTSAFQNAMLSVCAQVLAYRESGKDFLLKLPEKKRLRNLFINSNWAYLIDPYRCEQSSFSGHSTIPATQYKNTEQQQNAVNRIVNVILGAIPDMQRSDFAAFEWSVNELTDNVLVHSNSPIGGLVQVSVFQRSRKRVQFAVADAGIGIPNSLKDGHPEIHSDIKALDMAIREGITRDKNLGQGNGLFGSYQICSRSNGELGVHSGRAVLQTKGTELSISDENIPYDGTFVVATIDFSEPDLLADALQFKGRKYIPVDYVETTYEGIEDNKIIFKLIEEADSFGSRISGKPVRTKLSNLFQMAPECKVYIDFEGIPIISSSFADEAFAKLFLEAGAVEFMQKFEFVNAMETVTQLINRAISQRVSSGVVD